MSAEAPGDDVWRDAADHGGSLYASIPRVDQGVPGADALLDGFVAWVEARGIELYPAQEEAVLELLDDRHVVLNTPTGSGNRATCVSP